MKTRFLKYLAKILLISIFIQVFSVYGVQLQAKALDYSDVELKGIIETLYNHRSSAFVTGDFPILDEDFDVSRKQGIWTKEHEIKRIKYLMDWAADRGMKFTNVISTVRIKKVFKNTDPLKIALEETYKFEYIYPNDAVPVTNSFGVGIRHSLGLVKKNDKFQIAYDWYTDCFEDALKNYTPNTDNVNTNVEPKFKFNFSVRGSDYVPEKGRYDRVKAAQYADKYCGAANGEGNNFKYNKKYSDFNGIGGDCTNFASQVIGDSEGGGLKQDKRWYCITGKYGGGSGSDAWVNADGFKKYLIYSGKGRQIKRGTFEDLALPSKNYPNGAISKLDLGDLVCYAKGKNMDHFAVVTGWDSHGYPLVNSHTTDRYHVPWDLGWGDKNIFFHLIHVK